MIWEGLTCTIGHVSHKRPRIALELRDSSLQSVNVLVAEHDICEALQEQVCPWCELSSAARDFLKALDQVLGGFDTSERL